jgi:hypothetical protein
MKAPVTFVQQVEARALVRPASFDDLAGQAWDLAQELGLTKGRAVYDRKVFIDDRRAMFKGTIPAGSLADCLWQLLDPKQRTDWEKRTKTPQGAKRARPDDDEDEKEEEEEQEDVKRARLLEEKQEAFQFFADLPEEMAKLHLSGIDDFADLCRLESLFSKVINKSIAANWSDAARTLFRLLKTERRFVADYMHGNEKLNVPMSVVHLDAAINGLQGGAEATSIIPGARDLCLNVADTVLAKLMAGTQKYLEKDAISYLNKVVRDARDLYPKYSEGWNPLPERSNFTLYSVDLTPLLSMRVYEKPGVTRKLWIPLPPQVVLAPNSPLVGRVSNINGLLDTLNEEIRMATLIKDGTMAIQETQGLVAAFRKLYRRIIADFSIAVCLAFRFNTDGYGSETLHTYSYGIHPSHRLSDYWSVTTR